MRVATAFFAGVGTVVVAIGAGLGGGLLLGDIMSPQQPKHPSSEVTRLEQRSSPQPITAINGASQPAVPQVAATAGEASAQPQQQQQPQQTQQQQPQQAQPQVQPERNAPAQSAVAAAPPTVNAEPSAARAAPDDSFAKARDADLKRDARRVDDRRKADRRQQWGDDRRQWDERRQQWVDKRKWRERGNDDLGDVEASVRDATEPRSFFGR